ncbi:MAG: hypothetical protein IT440_13305 [Phycisphaeraceae bacterium]|nr:hypothetical protein [Phycisphaeraceae bacterium]
MSRLTFLALVGAAMMAGGCLEHGVSIDRHTYTSTPHQPTTITLVDTTTKEEFWKMDIPVCMRLRLDFDRSPESEGFYNNLNPASKLNWMLLPLDSGSPVDKGTCFFSGCRPFLIKVAYRKAPETADGDGGSIVRPCAKCADDGAAPAAPAGDAAAVSAAPAPAAAPGTPAIASATPGLPAYYSSQAQSGVISNSSSVTLTSPAAPATPAAKPASSQEVIVQPQMQAPMASYQR